MSDFIKGNFVKNEKGYVGKVTGMMGNGVYVFMALSGQNSFFDNPIPATQEEYNAQIEQRMHPAKPVQKVPAIPIVLQQTRPRWLCLDCGHTHNNRDCPLCGSDEKIYNVDMSHRGKS